MSIETHAAPTDAVIRNLFISTSPNEDGTISDIDLVDEIRAGALRIRTFMRSLWAMGNDGCRIQSDHLCCLTDLAEKEATRLEKLAKAWLDQKAGDKP